MWVPLGAGGTVVRGRMGGLCRTCDPSIARGTTGCTGDSTSQTASKDVRVWVHLGFLAAPTHANVFWDSVNADNGEPQESRHSGVLGEIAFPFLSCPRALALPRCLPWGRGQRDGTVGKWAAMGAGQAELWVPRAGRLPAPISPGWGCCAKGLARPVEHLAAGAWHLQLCLQLCQLPTQSSAGAPWVPPSRHPRGGPRAPAGLVNQCPREPGLPRVGIAGSTGPRRPGQD